MYAIAIWMITAIGSTRHGRRGRVRQTSLLETENSIFRYELQDVMEANFVWVNMQTCHWHYRGIQAYNIRISDDVNVKDTQLPKMISSGNTSYGSRSIQYNTKASLHASGFGIDKNAAYDRMVRRWKIQDLKFCKELPTPDRKVPEKRRSIAVLHAR